jgi:hypothetical protein
MRGSVAGEVRGWSVASGDTELHLEEDEVGRTRFWAGEGERRTGGSRPCGPDGGKRSENVPASEGRARSRIVAFWAAREPSAGENFPAVGLSASDGLSGAEDARTGSRRQTEIMKMQLSR